jgi:hypothetical protein
MAGRRSEDFASSPAKIAAALLLMGRVRALSRAKENAAGEPAAFSSGA